MAYQKLLERLHGKLLKRLLARREEAFGGLLVLGKLLERLLSKLLERLLRKLIGRLLGKLLERVIGKLLEKRPGRYWRGL